MDFPSFSTLFDIGRTEALIRNPQLTRDSIERPGSDGNILVAAAAAIGDEVVGSLVQVTSGLYLESATGTALDRLLLDRYGLERKSAASGVGTAKFFTVATNPAPFTIPAGTQIGTSDGIKYETVDPVVFNSGTDFVYATIRSLQAGLSQQVRANTLTNLLSQIPFAPADIGVTNPEATAGAVDRESDSDYRARGQAFWSTARRGTLSAIEQGALTVPGVIRASAFEGLDAAGNPMPYVQCVIADQYTDALANLGTVPPIYETQSQTLAQNVVTALRDYRPAGIFVYVQVAKVVLQPITLALTFVAGVATTEVGNSARAAVVNYVNNLAPGEPLDPDDLLAVLNTVSGLLVVGCQVLVPAGEVVPGSLEVLRTSANIVSLRTADGV